MTSATMSPWTTPPADNRAATASAWASHAANVRRTSPSMKASRSGWRRATLRSRVTASTIPVSSTRSMGSEGKDATGQFAVVEVVEHRLELLERIRRRHQFVEHELARLVQLDDLRDVGVRPDRAGPTTHDPPVDMGQPGEEDAELRLGRWHAEDDDVASPVQHLQTISHDRAVPDAVEHPV